MVLLEELIFKILEVVHIFVSLSLMDFVFAWLYQITFILSKADLDMLSVSYQLSLRRLLA